jgi:hypothetical protein
MTALVVTAVTSTAQVRGRENHQAVLEIEITRHGGQRLGANALAMKGRHTTAAEARPTT